MTALQKYLNAEIDQRGWSMDEFARRAQLSLSNAYLIVRDGKDNVRQNTFDNIAAALSMTPAELAVAIGKGAHNENPQRVTIQAVMREIPEEDLGTFERIARSFMRAKTHSTLRAKTRKPGHSTSSNQDHTGEDAALENRKQHPARFLALAGV